MSFKKSGPRWRLKRVMNDEGHSHQPVGPVFRALFHSNFLHAHGNFQNVRSKIVGVLGRAGDSGEQSNWTNG